MSYKAVKNGWDAASHSHIISGEQKSWFRKLASLELPAARAFVEKRAREIVDVTNTWSDELIEQIRAGSESASSEKHLLEELDFYITRLVELNQIAN